jgi:hypothetical protein
LHISIECYLLPLPWTIAWISTAADVNCLFQSTGILRGVTKAEYRNLPWRNLRQQWQLSAENEINCCSNHKKWANKFNARFRLRELQGIAFMGDQLQSIMQPADLGRVILL